MAKTYTIQNLGQSIVALPEGVFYPNVPGRSVTVDYDLSAKAIAAMSNGTVSISPKPSTVAGPAPDADVTNSVTVSSNTVTPNLDLGMYVTPATAIAANLTIANPTNSSQSKYAGLKMNIALLKDATGGTYTITYGSQYKGTTLGSFAATVSVKYLIEFTCDGTNWVQTGISAAYT